MPNYKLLIEYDGTDFHGWQFQPNLRTVQGELEKAATTFFREDIRLHPAGRTDSGVHARGMVANFKTDKQVSTERLKKALNGISGKDVVIHEVSIVNEEFNSRWSATGREYLYRISRVCSAIDRNFTYYVRDALDASMMNEAVHCLKGSHNFKAFSLAIPKEKHYLCRVEFAEWLEKGDEIYFRIKANRFLHGMVRILVGSSILVGKGMMTVEKFEQILQSQDSREAGYKAPPQGLCLMKVYYDND
ncbi:tRNA pseudouridine(38-40) synthase TruA [candidate division KSB1 bacterium]|nr:tRNA pseudouridine(38-40) synthase TruA [candidate division KSB1 bacterium]